jgi:sporulation protein YlmC with PRC-barrel domain
LDLVNSEKALTREMLAGMQVVDAEGKLIGKVKDVAFAIGKTGISLSVEDDEGQVRNVAWEEVQAASDFVVLKPAVAQSAVAFSQPVQSAQQSVPLCSLCGRPLSYIKEYQRWYCYNDKKYADV